MKILSVSLLCFFSLLMICCQPPTEGYYNRGKNRMHIDLRGAIDDFTKAIEINPSFEAYNSRGLAKKNITDYKGAINDFTKAIELNPKSIAAYKNRGETKHYIGNYEGAISDFTKAIEMDSDYPDIFKINFNSYAYYNRAKSKHIVGDYKGAIADFTKTIEMYPNNANAYFNRASSKINLDQNESACKDLYKADKLGNREASNLVEKYCALSVVENMLYNHYNETNK